MTKFFMIGSVYASLALYGFAMGAALASLVGAA